jgi:micrococcal nuclease
MQPTPRLLVAFVIILTAFLTGRFDVPLQLASLLDPQPTPATQTDTVTDGTVAVTQVIDGDTIEVEGGVRVRMIGINTPETVDPRRPVQCFGTEASRRTHELLDGQRIRLVKDVSETDKYGRLLRYVYRTDGTFVNLALVRDGYAQASAYPPDIAHKAEFAAVQTQARIAGLGLWGACR